MDPRYVSYFQTEFRKFFHGLETEITVAEGERDNVYIVVFIDDDSDGIHLLYEHSIGEDSKPNVEFELIFSTAGTFQKRVSIPYPHFKEEK